MSIKANDLRNCEFTKRMRGFDPEEVTAFLALVADQFEVLEQIQEAHAGEKRELESEL